MAERFDVLSPLSLAECTARLEALMQPKPWFSEVDPERPFFGKFKGVRLRLRRRSTARNT